MQESIKKRIEAVRRGAVPEGYNTDRAMLFPKEWGEPVALNTVLLENKDRNEDLRFGKDDVLSVSGERGIVNQIDLLGRSYAGESVAPYHIVETGDVVYTKSPLKQNPYGIIKQNRSKPGIVSTLYAVYHCNSPITGQYLENYFCIDTFLNNYLKPLVKRGAKNDMKVNNEEVLLGRIPMPPIEEQRKINSLIAQFDRVIDLKQKLIEEKRRQKQWLMQKLLDPNSGVRLPGYEQSEWVEVSLRDCCIGKGEYGLNAPACEYSPELPQYIRITDIDDNGKYMKTSPVSVYTLEADDYYLHEGDLLFVRTGGTTGKVYRYEKSDGLLVFAGFLIRFSINLKHFDAGFVYSQFETKEYANWVKVMSMRSGQPGINAEEYGGFRFWVPKARMEQQAIASILDCKDCELDLLMKDLKCWQQKKKALMQLLLTGLVRVNA